MSKKIKIIGGKTIDEKYAHLVPIAERIMREYKYGRVFIDDQLIRNRGWNYETYLKREHKKRKKHLETGL
jgi:hypothetical protein